MKSRLWSLIVGLVSALSVGSGFAAVQVNLRLQDVVAGDWRAEGVELAVTHSDQQPSIVLTIARLQLADWTAPFERVQLNCRSSRISVGSLECNQQPAQLVVSVDGTPQLVMPSIGATLEWSQGKITRLEVGAEIKRTDINTVISLLPESVGGDLQTTVTVTGGELSARVTVASQREQSASIEGSLEVSNLAFSDTMGTRAGENLAGKVEFSGDFDGDDLGFRISSNSITGDLFINPWFFSWSDQGPELIITGHWLAGQRRLALNGSYRHPDKFDLAGGATLLREDDQMQLLSTVARLRIENLATTYLEYLQPWLTGTLAGELQSSGELAARVAYTREQGITSLGLQLDDVSLVDEQSRFEITGLSANLPWRGANRPSSGQMSWGGLRLYRLPFGAGSSDLQFNRSQLALNLSPLTLFDGGFAGGKLAIQGMGSEQLTVTVGGELTPVSLPQLTAALGWPEMAGTLAAKVPAVHYQQGRIQLEGGVELNVFDGKLVMSNLVVENLFGLVPGLSADLRADDLDLALITHTFDFGDITGRLSGQVDGLRLEAWQPVAFDGWLQTPVGDPGPHKISQRALNSLSSIGGISGALQSTLLRFFDDFSYRRLGIGCRLAQGVCRMRGIADHAEGYYIVQGGGWWPQIDLVGYNRRVDWSVLLQRLIAATAVEQIEIR